MASQSTFSSCMHDQMLESNRDDVKLEAMRCVTVMTAKGKLSVPRTLFPHIVKNVSSKNPELKKLIYLYLTNFADQEPDLALLPVATLQKSLKSPNPLIRSSALKVLTSMRLGILSAILMATLRNSVNDLSPYVRKTVAHSIIKIYRLEPGLRSDLIEHIERLFDDKNSMVLSSAVATFEVVCPDNLDLVHKHYKRFCFILADCNEWGQTLLLNLLMRYILKIYRQVKSGNSKNYNPVEHDPKILLRSAKPLIHSNNSAVVMAVIKLYIAIANHNEVRSTITKPLIRLLYSHREIQLIVLNMIEDLTTLKEASIKQEGPGIENENDSSQSTVCGGTEKEINDKDKDNNAKLEQQNNHDLDVANHVEPEKSITDVQPITKDGYIALDFENGAAPSGEESKIETDEKENSPDGDRADGSLKENKESEDGEVDEESAEEEDEEAEGDDEEDDDDEEDGDEEEEDEEEDESNEEEVESDEVSELDKEVENKKHIEFDLGDLNANKDPNAYREVFRPYIKSFFVKHNDCTQIRLAKLKILTNLSSPVNVSLVLRELQAYISIYVDDKEFVSAAIHAIGRCAIIVKEVAHTCLNGLTSLLSNNNEHIVSEAIVVLRSQIINKKSRKLVDNDNEEQSNEKIGKDNTVVKNEVSQEEEETNIEDEKIVSTVIKQVTKLLPTVTAPQARATILWILAEFCGKNLTAAKCAPNVLRSIAKSFCQEDNFVKLQSLTLASKFLLSLDKEKKAELYHKVYLLAGYLFSLAKYDINHDVRDRGRFLKKLLDDEEICTKVLNGFNGQELTGFAIQTV